jgi:hypothetical protein
MGLPVAGIFALRPVLGLDGDGYRVALLVSLGWALLYLVLTLDPGVRDKLDVFRSLFSLANSDALAKKPEPRFRRPPKPPKKVH